IHNAYLQLKAFIEYYFLCMEAPSPLLPDWADAILRKKELTSFDSSFEDPVLAWVLARAELPEAQEWIQTWEPVFTQTFQGLIDLYPTRGARAKV
ncbi:MAG: hypothetical protein KGQ49_04650, partial [Verrucomicrobia bacterium]|nr:hypothetical protein [Verrucomicrobiota bacterium]